jgi:hypothetical protein
MESMTVFNALGSSATSYFNPQTAKVYTSKQSDPFYESPLDVALSVNSSLQSSDPYTLATGTAETDQITKAIQNAKTAATPSTAAHVDSDAVTQGQAAITAMMSSFTSQYQYSIDGQTDQTYEDLSQSVPSTLTSVVKDARTTEVEQLATIANSGADAATQAGQSAQVRISFLSGAASELQTGAYSIDSSGSTTTAADPATAASALNDLVTELQTAVQEYDASRGSTPDAQQDSSFAASAQDIVTTLHTVALALVPQLAAGTTPQYFNSDLYNATQNLTAIETTLQHLSGSGSGSSSSQASSSASSDLGNNLNTSA